MIEIGEHLFDAVVAASKRNEEEEAYRGSTSERERERDAFLPSDVVEKKKRRFNVAIHNSPPPFPRKARLNVLIVDGIFPGRRIPNVSVSIYPPLPLLLSSSSPLPPPVPSPRREQRTRRLYLRPFDDVSPPFFHPSRHFPRETLETFPPRDAGEEIFAGQLATWKRFGEGGIKAW